MTTPELLNNDDRCERLAYLSSRWKPQLITPIQALYESVESGLIAQENPWDVAEDTFMELATTRGLDSNQTDLLGGSEHMASLASLITFILRPKGPWKRPELVTLPNGSIWTPQSFLDPKESHLRRIVLCQRWNAYRQIQEEHDWRTLETSIYGVPMDLYVIVIGQKRDGRYCGPLTTGYRHPVSKTLRFMKRDGEKFGPTWNRVSREKDKATKEEWLDAMVTDGVLPEVVMVHSTPVPEDASVILHFAEKKLARIMESKKPQEPRLSICFDRTRLCPFRSACPKEPSNSTGFVKSLD